MHLPVNASEASGVDTPAESLPVSVSMSALKDRGVGAFWPTPCSRMNLSAIVRLSISAALASLPNRRQLKLFILDVEYHDEVRGLERVVQLCRRPGSS